MNPQNESNSMEVIDIGKSFLKCNQLPAVPSLVKGSIAALGFTQNPVVCGGIEETAKC
jgi:hypothetical protein